MGRGSGLKKVKIQITPNEVASGLFLLGPVGTGIPDFEILTYPSLLSHLRTLRTHKLPSTQTGS